MNADAFRHLYDYHFTANRKIWELYIVPLTQEQFTHPTEYSIGSIHKQVVHMINIDELWFSGLRGVEMTEFIKPEDYTQREKIRTKWDEIEQQMRNYLNALRDDMLLAYPLEGTEDAEMPAWQVLIHTINHGTDHRAQLLMLLHNLGVKTTSQDYFFYIKDDFMTR